MNKVFTYIDLFSGCGGFSLGFDNQNYQNIFSLDFEPSFCKTYKFNFPNHKLIEKDICNLTEQEISGIVGKKNVNVIIGGPPCQGFSMAGKIGRKFIDDPRNNLFKEFSRIINIIKPEIFVMENVQRLSIHNKGKTKLEMLSEFESIGYNVDARVLDAVNYGAPQFRKRIIFIGTINQKNIQFPSLPSEYIFEKRTISDAINHFPPLKSGESSNIPNHTAMNHADQMLKKMSYIGDGGSRIMIPEKLRPTSGDARKYIKYDSKKPSIPITGDMRKVFHYSQNRALTVRELASIQTFPDNFIFKGSSISQQQQVGNAVPPILAEAIAKCVKSMLEK